MTPPDPALVGALVVAAIGVSADIYFLGGAKFARQYEKESEEFYKENHQVCRDMDELAGVSFTRALITSELWRIGTVGTPVGDPSDEETRIQALEVRIRQSSGKVRTDLDNLTTQFRTRTGNKEKLEKLLSLYEKCAGLTKKAWASFAILISALAIMFAWYVSIPNGVNSTWFVLLGLAAFVAGAVTFDAATDWQRDSAALKKCKTEIKTTIRTKIHFPESDVAGLQAPPAAPRPAPVGAVGPAMGPTPDSGAGKTGH
ncbi:MAG: hypothetical protein L3J68_00255 [Thermoplasmata archaeon]|nr:hypothetical protein [Thermoplasmata archaeon]